jgi:hypothetical protein
MLSYSFDELLSQIDREQWLADTKIALDALKCIAYFADDQPEIGVINLTRVMGKSMRSPIAHRYGQKINFS